MKILVTGGAGYIGSHTTLELLRAGHDLVVVDNLSNSHEEALRRVEELAGRRLTFYRADLLDRERLAAIFDSETVDAVIHFAALKAVGESVAQPLRYYRNNVSGTLNLIDVMAAHGVRRLVFSSSATVYGDPQIMPIPEETPLAPFNPYGRTKAIVEGILQDLYRSDPRWAISILRYFNPVGADPSGMIGEDPNGIPNNLVPFITQVAIGRLPYLAVFGNTYPTPDGSGIRDYIHVVDLARGHLKALDLIAAHRGIFIHNLGTGRGYSVLEVIAAFERAIGRAIPWQVAPPRPGDAAISFADVSRAAQELGWKAEKDLSAMATDSWRWQSQNPNGYQAR